MAKVIVAWCDPHMADDEQVPGKSFQIALDGQKPVEVDLCEQHEKEFLTPLLLLLGEVGQPVVEPTAKVKVKRFTCPECQKGLSSRDSFGKHLRNQHGKGLGEIEEVTASQEGVAPASAPEVTDAGPRPLAFPCPSCERSFETPQGRGAHRSSTHGYVSPSAPARAEAEKKRTRKSRAASQQDALVDA